MGGKKKICDIGKNKNINIPLEVSLNVFEKLGINPKTSYIMDIKKAIFRLYNLSNPDLSISSPRKTLEEQQPNNAYGVPINEEELNLFVQLFGLDKNDWFQESVGRRIVKDILNNPIDTVQMQFVK
jgi:hypothetical protein